MATISTPIPPVTASTQTAAPPASQTQPTKPDTATNKFGEAVTMDLSAPAKTIVSNNTGAPAQGSVPATPSTPDVAQLVAAAKQKVAPLVGMSGASDVVDNQGNISKSRLAIEIAEQAQKE